MDDYIKRDFALDVVKRTSGDYAAAWVEIAHAPAADVAPVVHGRRIKSMPVLGAGNIETHCSVCGRILHEENAPYCYCGAKFAEGND